MPELSRGAVPAARPYESGFRSRSRRSASRANGRRILLTMEMTPLVNGFGIGVLGRRRPASAARWRDAADS